MRKEFSRKTKAAAYERCKIKGVPCCEGIAANGTRCALPLQVGRFTYDHRDPDWFSKDNSLDNCAVLGWCCDRPKTAKDQQVIAKSKRIRDKHTGAFHRRHVMPGSKASRFKKKMNGEVVLR